MQGHSRETDVHPDFFDSENPPPLTERMRGSEEKSRAPWLVGLLAIALYADRGPNDPTTLDTDHVRNGVDQCLLALEADRIEDEIRFNRHAR